MLKGPQGTLYGQNATGGAIIVTTRKPSFSPTAKVSASYGSYDAIDLRAFASGPLSQTVAVSVAGAYQNRNGFRDNVAAGESDSGLDSTVVRAKLLYEPTESLSFTLGGYVADRKDSSVVALQPLGNSSIGYRFFPDAPRFTSHDQYGGSPDMFNRSETDGLTLRGDWTADLGTLTLNLTRTDSKVTALFDLDNSPVSYADYRIVNLATDTEAAELTFTSRKFGAVSLLAGALYFSSDDAADPSYFYLRVPSVYPAPVATAAQLLRLGRNQKQIVAGYAEINYDVTDRLALTVGGRYTEEKQRAFGGEVSYQAHTYNPTTWSQFTPRATAHYAFTSDHSVYVSYAEGFKGGWIPNAAPNDAPLKPEQINAWEIGYKGRPTDSLAVTAAAFLYDYKDMKVVTYVPPNLYIARNAATSRGQGVEATLNWAASSHLTVSGGVAYLDAEFDNYQNAQGYVSNGFGNTSTVLDLSGERLPRAPEWSGNLSGQYEFDLAAGQVGASASLYFTSKYIVEPTSTVMQDRYTTIGAEVFFKPASLPDLRMILWGKNLTDEDYFAAANVNAFNSGVAYADPRTCGIRVEYEF